MAIQLEDIQLILWRPHHTLMSDPKQTAEHIPQLIWVIIKSSCYIYNTVCTKNNLDPEDSNLPHLPTASLDSYAFLLKAKLPIEVNGIPDQWLLTHKWPTPAHTTAAPKPTSWNNNQPRQQTPNPFNPSSSTSGVTHTCLNQPTVSVTNEILCDLKNK